MIVIIMIAHVIWLLYMISFTMCYQRLSNHNNVDEKPTHSPHLLYGHKWPEPYFDVTMPRNITSLVGKSAYLGCRVKNLGNKTVAWIRHRDLHILTVGTYTYTTDQRFQTTFHRDIDEWTLQIKWAQKRDAGTYECQISTQPVRSFSVDLNIVDHISEEKSDLLHQFFNDDAFYINSDRVYQGQDDEFANLYGPIQKVTVPTATILGGPDLYVDKGSTINLTCAIKFSPEPPTHIFWYHQDKVIGEDHSRGRISFMATKGEGARSILRIEDADITDSGKYSCFPSNTDMASIRVHVLNGERPEAMQTSGTSSLLYNTFDIRRYHYRYHNYNKNNNNNNFFYHQINSIHLDFIIFFIIMITIIICSQLNFYHFIFIIILIIYENFINIIFNIYLNVRR